MNMPKLRKKLYAEDPHCYWCGRITQLVRNSGQSRKEFKFLRPTIDHIYSAFHPCKRKDNGATIVLACSRCNSYRGGFESKYCAVDGVDKNGKTRKIIKHPDPIVRLIGMYTAMTDFYLRIIPEVENIKLCP